jgi:hypothetical protein
LLNVFSSHCSVSFMRAWNLVWRFEAGHLCCLMQSCLVASYTVSFQYVLLMDEWINEWRSMSGAGRELLSSRFLLSCSLLCVTSGSTQCFYPMGGWQGICSCVHYQLDQMCSFSPQFCAFSSWSIDNLKSHPTVPDQSPCLLPGFRVLNDFLAHHVHIPEVYLIVSAFFLQMPLTELKHGPKVGSWSTPRIENTLGFLIPKDSAVP